MKKKFLVFLLLGIFPILLFSQKTILHCGYILDVESGHYIKNASIVISGNTIEKIEQGWVEAKSASDKVVDLKNHYILPGLIDMHVHLEEETSKDAQLKTFIQNDVDYAFESVVYADKTIKAGFTTVRDLGGSGVNIALRNAINKKLIVGPRVYTVGKAIGTTGGHADPTNGYREDLMGDPSPIDGVINGVDDARKAVRQRYKSGADWIKITATGGVLSVAKNGANPQFTLEELQAIVSTAQDYELQVAAHAHGDEGMQRAVLAGVKTIEHGTYMSEKTMDLMIEKNAYYVPTITAGKFVAAYSKVEGYYPPLVAPKAAAIGPQIQSTFSKAFKRGVKIAFGTDAGVFPHGENAKEFAYMVEAGMPPLKAIQSATIVNAELLGRKNDLGKIKENFLADIIAVKNDPLKEISTLEKVIFVMKDGDLIIKP